MERPIGTTTYPVEAQPRAIETGSIMESIGGAGAVVLAILGLIGVMPELLLAIATMAVGVALFLGGASLSAQSNRIAHSRRARREISSGVGMAAFAGIGGAALGLLALLQVNPFTLLSVAAIVLGGGLVLASAGLTKLEDNLDAMDAEGHHAEHETMAVAGGTEILVGLGAIALGILALSGVDPMTLTLIAALSMGASTLLSGSSLAGRVFSLFG